ARVSGLAVDSRKPPIGSSLAAGVLALRRRSKSPLASHKAVMISASLISRWSFVVLVLIAASPGTLLARCWRYGGSLGPQPGAARRQESDLAGGKRALFLLYPRPLAPAPGQGTPTRWILEDQERITVVRWLASSGVIVTGSRYIRRRIDGNPCWYLLINTVLLICLLDARMLPAKRELRKRGSKTCSSQWLNMTPRTNPLVDTSLSSPSDDCYSSQVVATNDPTRESGSLHHNGLRTVYLD
ncbi:hypothetical protein T07_14605, partial [Trichinella nelsoni]